jgi:hypothetical protein
MTIGDGRRVTDRVVPILDPPPRGIVRRSEKIIVRNAGWKMVPGRYSTVSISE